MQKHCQDYAPGYLLSGVYRVPEGFVLNFSGFHHEVDNNYYSSERKV
jgi:hypothetical protein